MPHPLALHIKQRLLSIGISLELPPAVAVSGGADSMALLLLCREVFPAHVPVFALTVDHGLREESAREARFVAKQAARFKCEHMQAKWRQEHTRVTGNLQSQARNARYMLLQRMCEEKGLNILLTAHHAGDQAETAMLRLLRGAGTEGLAAIRTRSRLGDHLHLIRPALDIAPQALRCYLHDRECPFVEDPSNANTCFMRVRVRQFLRSLPLPEESFKRISASTRALRDDANYLKMQATRIAEHEHGVYWRNDGRAVFSPLLLQDTPPPLMLRIFSAFLHRNTTEPPPRADLIKRMAQRLRLGKEASAYGWNALPTKDGGAILTREAALCPHLTIRQGKTYVWDQRFRIRMPSLATLPTQSDDRLLVVPAVNALKHVKGYRAALPVALTLDRKLVFTHIHIGPKKKESAATKRLPCIPIKFRLYC